MILLTSKLTGSAAEILTMALRELSQVTVMGEATSGGLSDILSFKFPNGWGLGLSHQTYRTMDGDLFEAVGIPPDVHFAIDAAPLLLGEDPLLRAAFARTCGLISLRRHEMRRLNSGAHIDRADPADNGVTGRHGQLRKNRRQMLNVKKHLDQIKRQGARPQHGHPLGIEILE